MAYQKILTVQDISCVGQCSLTVALPILSAAGMETCILPSAVLSTHTAGFSGYTVRDLTLEKGEYPFFRHLYRLSRKHRADRRCEGNVRFSAPGGRRHDRGPGHGGQREALSRL